MSNESLSDELDLRKNLLDAVKQNNALNVEAQNIQDNLLKNLEAATNLSQQEVALSTAIVELAKQNNAENNQLIQKLLTQRALIANNSQLKKEELFTDLEKNKAQNEFLETVKQTNALQGAALQTQNDLMSNLKNVTNLEERRRIINEAIVDFMQGAQTSSYPALTEHIAQLRALSDALDNDIAMQNAPTAGPPKPLQQTLIEAIGKNVDGLSTAGSDIQKELVANIEKEKDLKEQISLIDKAMLELETAAASGDDSVKPLLAQLKAMKSLVQKAEKMLDINNRIKENFLDVFGATEDIAKIFKTGGLLYAGSEAFKNSAEAVKESFSNIFGTAFEMYKTMGLNVKESAAVAGELAASSWSMTRLLYGGEALAESSKALVDEFGNVNMATSDMIEGVTEINALVGDAGKSVQLALIFQEAGVAATEVNDMVKEIGSETGVAANKIMQEMAENQISMVGASKQELKMLQKHTAELIKQGVSRKGLLESAKGMMDVEGTINSANKLALLTGKQINVSELAGAAMAVRTAKGKENQRIAEEKYNELLKQQIDSMGGIENLSHMEIELLAESLHITEEELEKRLHANAAQEHNNELLKEANVFVDTLFAGFTSVGQGVAALAIELVKMIGQAMIFNKVMHGNFGFDKMFGGMGKSLSGFAGKAKDLFGSIGKGIAKSFGFGGAAITAAGSTLADNVGGGLADTVGDKLTEKAEGVVDDKIGEVTDNATDKLLGKAEDAASPEVVADNTSKVGKAGQKTGNFGKQVGDNLKGLAAGLEKMGTGKVLKGALNLIPTALGFVIIVPGIPGMFAVSALGVGAGAGLVALGEGLKKMGAANTSYGALNLSLAAVGFTLMTAGAVGLAFVAALGVGAGAGLVGLGVGLKSMGAANTSIGALNLSLAAVGFTLMTAGAVGLAAIALLGIPAAAGLQALAVGLSALGASSVAGLIGIGLLALFGVALIPLTFALSLLAPLIESIGNVIAKVIPAIGTAIATIVGSIGELVTKLILIASPEVAGGLALFGLALIPLGIGLAALAVGLAILTPVLPTLTALVALGAGIALIADALGIGGGGSSETTSSDTKKSDPLLEEIRGLRADIKAQPINVVLNNKIVGEINRSSRAINSYVNK